jgi:hypothetical protein
LQVFWPRCQDVSDYVLAAGIAIVDPRAVRRVVDGKPTLSTTRRRVVEALIKLALLAP